MRPEASERFQSHLIVFLKMLVQLSIWTSCSASLLVNSTYIIGHSILTYDTLYIHNTHVIFENLPSYSKGFHNVWSEKKKKKGSYFFRVIPPYDW